MRDTNSVSRRYVPLVFLQCSRRCLAACSAATRPTASASHTSPFVKTQTDRRKERERDVTL